MLAIDFETYPISEEQPYPKPVCLSYAGNGTSGLLSYGEIESFLDKKLDREVLIAHNSVFECNVIYAWYPSLRNKLLRALDEGRIICTKINEQLINLQRKQQKQRFNLAALVEYYLNKDISDTKGEDTWRTRYHELYDIPISNWPQEVIDYAVNDSVLTYRVYSRQEKLKTREIVKAEFYLNLIASKGMYIDASRVDQLEEEIYTLLQPHYKLLIDKGILTAVKGRRRPKTEAKKLKSHVTDIVDTPLYTPKGNVRHDHEALHQYLLETNDEVIGAYLNVIKYDKVLTAFISRLKNNTKIRTQYSALVSTGRTSSSTCRFYPSVNIQQMPRTVERMTWDVRNCFVPRKGYQLCSIDYAGLELASTAHQLKKTFKKSKLCDTLNAGEDPVDMHSMFACRIASIKWGRKVTYEEFVKNKKEKEYAQIRQLAKPINLGFPGGIGYDTMRKLLLKDGIKTSLKVLETSPNQRVLYHAWKRLRTEFPNLRVARLGKDTFAIVEDELVLLKKELFKLYPDLELFLKDHHLRYIDGKNFRWVKNEYGEWEKEPAYYYNQYGINRKWCTYTSFCNGYLMQTPSAVGAKKMVCDVTKKYLNSDKVNVLAFIHDEILFEVVDSSEKYAIIKDIADIMIDSMQSVLSNTRICVEASLMDYWSKSNEIWGTTVSKKNIS